MGNLDGFQQAAGLGSAGTQPTGSPVAAVLQMLRFHPGGLMGVVEQFRSAGLGGAASSWLGQGANQAVSLQEVQTALGAGPVGQIAQQLGVSHDQAAGHIAQLLPMIVDHLTPHGVSPSGGGASEIGGLLARLAGR